MLKQTSNEQQWQEIWDNATRNNPKEKIRMMSDKAKQVIVDNYDSRTIIGYSGGKDSLVLRHLCEQCIDKPLFISCLHQNEFPAFTEWLRDTAPKMTVFVEDYSLDLDFLNKHLSYLFPHDKKEKNAFVVAWRKPTFSWMGSHGRTKLLTGKRTDDGNVCGSFNALGCKQTELKKPHVVSLNPLADWKHDELLAYIQYNGIQLPEIYYYPNGFRFGTHPWTERRRLNMRYRDTFDEIMELDESILKNAALRLEIANLYLKGQLNF